MAQVLQYHYDLEYFVWVDESGNDAKNHIRKLGYSLFKSSLLDLVSSQYSGSISAISMNSHLRILAASLGGTCMGGNPSPT